MIVQPALDLADALGVLHAGEGDGLGGQFLLVLRVHQHGVGGQLPVDPDAVGIDACIQRPEAALRCIRHPLFQVVIDGAHGLHIAHRVLLEARPLLRVVLRQVALPLAIGLCGLAGRTEVADQRSAVLDLRLLLRQSDGLACSA